MATTYRIIVCPQCSLSTLPPGCVRARCSECDCFFATADERPEDRDRMPQWWPRHSWQYAEPGRQIEVVAVTHGARRVASAA